MEEEGGGEGCSVSSSGLSSGSAEESRGGRGDMIAAMGVGHEDMDTGCNISQAASHSCLVPGAGLGWVGLDMAVHGIGVWRDVVGWGGCGGGVGVRRMVNVPPIPMGSPLFPPRHKVTEEEAKGEVPVMSRDVDFNSAD